MVVARKEPLEPISSALVERSIPAAFEEIARAFPGHIAIKTNGRAVTYGDLDATANRIACQLLTARGDNPETIALWMEPGADQLAAILGTLKAGKIGVLLDPQTPMLRLQTIIEDSGAALIIAHEATASDSHSLAQAAGIQEIVLRENQPAHDLDGRRVALSPHSLAFIFYTSGSTGTPKGVVWNHRNVLHNVMLYKRSYRTGGDDRITLLSSATANSVMNMFLPLIDGATLLPFNVRKEGVNALAKWLLAERVSVLWLSTPLYRSLADTLTESTNFPDLRLVRFSSDTVRAEDIDRYKKLFQPSCRLVLGLATSETGLLTAFSIDHCTALSGTDILVGYSVEDTEVFLSDADDPREDGGAEGEIVVRSDYLSPGYWRNPTLTAAKFKADPLDPAKHIYYTGDLGLIHADGYLVHKGRKDFRVKIHGYGVDLADVESALVAHDRVRQAVVIAHRAESAETQLLAYYVGRDDQSPGGLELRNHLMTRLPDHMIPAKFIRLKEIPLTANGKINRVALPLSDNSRPELDVPYAAPQSDCQHRLTEIWQESLSLESVGINDNFFLLGGDSLKATKVLNRVLREFQLDLSTAFLFESPTVAMMAEKIVALQATRVREDNLETLLTELESAPERDD